MAPEILGEAGHNMLSDMWSLGILLYELASGLPPFNDADLDTMAEKIRFEDMPTHDYFTDEFESLLAGLTNKNPANRLGSKGIDQVKKHPFFKNVKWDQVLAKQLKPPIIPSKKALSKLPRDEQTGEVNPYALLSCNFDREFYDRDICIWNQAATTQKAGPAAQEPVNVSNFTYDQNNPKAKNFKGTSVFDSTTSLKEDALEMGSMGCEKSMLCLRVGSIEDRDRFAFADQLLLTHSRESTQSFNKERVVADRQLQYQ